MNKITLNGYVLTDKDNMLIVQGWKTRRIATVSESIKNHIPLIFAKKGHAEMMLNQIKSLPLTPSAKTYCISFRVKHANVRELVSPKKCTVTIEFD